MLYMYNMLVTNQTETVNNDSILCACVSIVLQGKPFQEAMVEVAYAVSFFEWFSEQVKRLDGDILAAPKRGQRILITKQPVGVAALITPWNFPIAMVARKASAALAAGCATVLKPSEERHCQHLLQLR